MPSEAPNFRELYKFEKYLEAGFEIWLNTNQELKLLGTAKVTDTGDAVGDSLQHDTPRVECFAIKGEPVGRPPHFIFDAQGNRRENGWHAIIHLGALTTADADIHDEYRAAVREIVSQADNVLFGDNPYLPYHEVSQCFSGQDDPRIEPEKGFYLTKMTFNIIFAILNTAWPGGLLNNPTPIN